MVEDSVLDAKIALGKPNEGIEGLLKDCAEYRSLAEAAVKEASQICLISPM
jgi:hypothetical protein